MSLRIGPSRNELKPPPGAAADADASEVLRVWIIKDGLHVSLTKAFDDPAVWGVMLVDLARHAARVYEREGDCDAAEALERIKQCWSAEMSRPTDLGTTAVRTDA